MAEGDKSVIRKIPINGGAPAQVGVASKADALCVSRKLLAYFDADAKAKTPAQLVVVPFTGGAPVKTFDFVPPSPGEPTGLSWSPDGRALVYFSRDPRSGRVGLWWQTLDGGPPTPFGDFSPGNIYSFAFSHDGKWLALARGSRSSDAVLISEVK